MEPVSCFVGASCATNSRNLNLSGRQRFSLAEHEFRDRHESDQMNLAAITFEPSKSSEWIQEPARTRMYHQDLFGMAMVVLSWSLYLRQNAFAEDSTSTWSPSEDSWNYWWSYSGVSGPAYWGLLNLDWYMCDRGRRQSPINIETESLVYDPHLTPLRADNNLISGLLYNDGHALVFNVSAARSPLSKDNSGTIAGQIGAGLHLSNSSISKRKRSNQQNDHQQYYSSLSAQNNVELPDSSAFLRELDNTVGLSISETNGFESSLEKSSALDSNLNTNEVSDHIDSGSAEGEQNQINDSEAAKVQLTGGSLAYTYRLEALHLRFGVDSSQGSEHQINSVTYAAELQVIAYNSLLFKSYTEAFTKPQGLMAIAILIEPLPENSSAGNEQLNSLLKDVGQLKQRGSFIQLNEFNLSALLPTTDDYVTYEGSLTTPGCYESVTWILLNKPLYIARSDLDALRSMSADEQSASPTGTLIAGNVRPVQPVNNRPIRTNIRPTSRGETCRQLRSRYEYKHKR